MEISYHKLWNLLDRRGIDLRRCVGMDRWPDEETYRALCENRNLPVEPLLELCRLLDCTLEDIAEFRAADGTIVLLTHRDPAVPGLFNPLMTARSRRTIGSPASRTPFCAAPPSPSACFMPERRTRRRASLPGWRTPPCARETPPLPSASGR